MSEDQLLAYQARFTKKSEPCKDEADEGGENKLQKRAEDYCRSKGFYFFHDKSKKINEPGNPDLVICLPKGRTVWVELKSKSGSLRKAQVKVATQLLGMGHEWYECRSYKRFLGIIEGNI